MQLVQLLPPHAGKQIRFFTVSKENDAKYAIGWLQRRPVHKAAQLIGIKPKSQNSLVNLIKYMHCLFQSEAQCVLLHVSSS